MFSRAFLNTTVSIPTHALTWASGAFGGIRTPNLLIRNPNFGVREGYLWSPSMAFDQRVRAERSRAESSMYRVNRYISDTSTSVDSTF